MPEVFTEVPKMERNHSTFLKTRMPSNIKMIEL